MTKSMLSFGQIQEHERTRYRISVLPSHVKTDVATGLRKLARRCGLTRTSRKIKTRRFPDYSPQLESDYFLIEFLREISAMQIYRLLDCLGYEPATLRETLCWFKQQPRRDQRRLLSRRDLIVIGPKKEGRRGFPVPYIDHNWNLRMSHGCNFWPNQDVFLVRPIEIGSHGMPDAD